MLAEALKRTLLLMRTDLADSVSDQTLLAALTGTTVVLSAGEDVLATHSGQSAIVAAALTMARTGHRVLLDIPDVQLFGPQPPLREDASLIEALLDCGSDLLPGRAFETGRPAGADFAIAFGSARPAPADLALAVNATDWAALLSGPETPSNWKGGDWPVGGFAAAAIAAGEAFKTAMRKLRDHASTPLFDDWYAPTRQAEVRLAEEDAAKTVRLGAFDMISGGAISNAALFALLRLPGAEGVCRVLDDDASAMSNLNRNALLRRSRLELPKVEDLANYGHALRVQGFPVRYERRGSGVELAETVLVGVDHIPSRWAVQRTGAAFVGVGATDRFTVQVSTHRPGQPCAGCAYPYGNDAGGDIPTVAFVSFWSGLLLAVELLVRGTRDRGEPPPQRLFCALRPESFVSSSLPLAFHADCPLRCGASKAA